MVMHCLIVAEVRNYDYDYAARVMGSLAALEKCWSTAEFEEVSFGIALRSHS